MGVNKMGISINKVTLLAIVFSLFTNQSLARTENVTIGEIKSLREIEQNKNEEIFDYEKHVPHKVQPKTKLKLTAVNSGIPELAYNDMQALADYGIISLPAGVTSVKLGDFSRKDMALLTIKALDVLGLKDTPVNKSFPSSAQGAKEALELKSEFDYELRNYGKDELAVFHNHLGHTPFNDEDFSAIFRNHNNNKYMIVLTDGVPNVALNYDKSYYSDDVISKTKSKLQQLKYLLILH